VGVGLAFGGYPRLRLVISNQCLRNHYLEAAPKKLIADILITDYFEARGRTQISPSGLLTYRFA
jgi:hypothetical protein